MSEMNQDPLAPSENGNALRAKLKRIFLYGGAILLVLFTVVGIHTYNRESTDDAQVEGHAAPISARVSGSVQDILVQDNEAVKAGQVLVKLDPRDIAARVAQARAALDAAKAEVVAAGADHRKAQLMAEQGLTSDIARAQSIVNAQEALAEKAQSDLQRLAPLAQRAEISQQQFDAAKAEAKVAESQLAGARQQLDAAHQEAGSREAGAEAQGAKTVKARASVEQAQADLETLQLQLSYCTVTAPIDGIVTHKTVQIGQVLQPGQSLMTIVPTHPFVVANFKETQLAKMRAGQKATVKVDMNGRTFDGVVDSIAGATSASQSLLPPENATGNFVKVVQRIPVKITFDGKDAENAGLRPGMNVSVTVFTK